MGNVILGLHCGYMHDSGAALIIDGKIAAIILQERMSRTKKDPYFPKEAILKCLEIAGLTPADVDAVALAAKDIQFQPKGLSKDYFEGNGGYFTGTLKRTSLTEIFNTKRWTKEFKKNQAAGERPFHDLLEAQLLALGVQENTPFVYCDHHTSHVASAYFTSGRVKANNGYVFVIDGYGDEKSVSAYHFSPESTFPEKILEMHYLSSPGLLYSRATEYMGMKPNRHEGKVTGLSGYGNPKTLLDKTEQFLKYNYETKQFDILAFQGSALMTKIDRGVSLLRSMLGTTTHTAGQPILDQMENAFHGHSKEDVAAAVQFRFDKEVTSFIKDVIKDETPGAILLAGGIFANVKTNAHIAEMYPQSELYVHPGMTDEGVALGAALYADYSLNKRSTRRPLDHVYYGPGYDADYIDDFVSKLDKDKFEVTAFDRNTKEGEAQVAALLDQRNVVGLFYGRMEYGPRALGARTILADTRDGAINDTINKRLNRTEYMPFAPVVLEEYADELFEIRDNIRYTSYFMTVICDVKPAWREKISAVVHVDGTARPQLINESINPVYFHILNEYRKITGIPTLVNTSFNAHEEPILENPSHGINSLNQDNIDYLYLYPYLIRRK